MNTSSPTRKCSQCGSELIQLSSVTEKIGNSLFPQTTVSYRCSNEECQEEREKQTKKRLAQKEEKERIENEKKEKRSQRMITK